MPAEGRGGRKERTMNDSDLPKVDRTTFAIGALAFVLLLLVGGIFLVTVIILTVGC